MGLLVSETRPLYTVPEWRPPPSAGCDDRAYRVTVRGSEVTYLVQAESEGIAYRLVLDQEAWVTTVRRTRARRQGWAFASGAAEIEVEEETK